MLLGRFSHFNRQQRVAALVQGVRSRARELWRWVQPQLVVQWLRGRERRRFRRRLNKALELRPRGGESKDHLSLSNVSTRLEIEWHARDIHPWDGDLPPERKARLFAEESQTHTVVAIRRTFERFPEVDAIGIRVLEPHKPHAVLFTGTVSRDDLKQCSPSLSPAMTLKLLGIEYRIVDGHLKSVR
jgi:hypothetical protein